MGFNSGFKGLNVYTYDGVAFRKMVFYAFTATRTLNLPFYYDWL